MDWAGPPVIRTFDRMTLTDVPAQQRTRAELLDAVRRIGPVLQEHADRHDRDGTFVTESYDALRDAGLLAIGVPIELGGDGASIGDVAAVQRELAHWCGSTALASSMHQHVVAFTAWRYRRGLPGAEATLRRVADEGIVLVSTGGGDFTHPSGTAVRTEGGYLVSGRKRFASQSPVGAAMATMFTYDDSERGRRVLNLSIPMGSTGVALDDTWDALGMRGTGSGDIVLHDVFVADDRVLADRPHGVIDPPLQVILTIAMPIIAAVYLGVAEAASAAAVASLEGKPTDALVQRQVGEMVHRLRVASWALDGAVAEIGPDPSPSAELALAALTAKREVALAGAAVCDSALAIAGGSAFFRGSTIERCVRDIRAAMFHPLTPERTLVYGGRLALGLETDVV